MHAPSHHQSAGVCGWSLSAGTDWSPQQKTGSQLRSAVPAFLPSHLYSMCNHEDRNAGVHLPSRAPYITQCTITTKYGPHHTSHWPVKAHYISYQLIWAKSITRWPIREEIWPVGDKTYISLTNMSKTYCTLTNQSKTYFTPAIQSQIYSKPTNQSKIPHTSQSEQNKLHIWQLE